MINFVICDNEIEITNSVKRIISKVMFKTNIDYKTYIFNSYNNRYIWKSKIYNAIEKLIGIKIYNQEFKIENHKQNILKSNEINIDTILRQVSIRKLSI